MPVTQWGWAVRTNEVCPKHNLKFVRLIRKGARPWDIGCPLCHHINGNRESLAEIPSINESVLTKLESLHIYTAVDLAKSSPEWIATTLDISVESANQMLREAERAVNLLRQRSECRKFIREHLVPKKGRKNSTILKSLKEAGVNDISGLAQVDSAVLIKAGVSEKEATSIITEARMLQAIKLFKEIGIPIISVKKYQSAGVLTPQEFCSTHPVLLAERSGIGLDTVYRHSDLVCRYLKLPVPKKMTKIQLEKGKKELLTIRGITTAMIIPLLHPVLLMQKVCLPPIQIRQQLIPVYLAPL